MKKLFFSALALIAFSATSLASGNLKSETTLDSKIFMTNSVDESQSLKVLTDCVDHQTKLTTYSVYDDCETGNQGIQITITKVTVTMCDDGSYTIRQGWN